MMMMMKMMMREVGWERKLTVGPRIRILHSSISLQSPFPSLSLSLSPSGVVVVFVLVVDASTAAVVFQSIYYDSFSFCNSNSIFSCAFFSLLFSIIWDLFFLLSIFIQLARRRHQPQPQIHQKRQRRRKRMNKQRWITQKTKLQITIHDFLLLKWKKTFSLHSIFLLMLMLLLL